MSDVEPAKRAVIRALAEIAAQGREPDPWEALRLGDAIIALDRNLDYLAERFVAQAAVPVGQRPADWRRPREPDTPTVERLRAELLDIRALAPAPPDPRPHPLLRIRMPTGSTGLLDDFERRCASYFRRCNIALEEVRQLSARSAASSAESVDMIARMRRAAGVPSTATPGSERERNSRRRA